MESEKGFRVVRAIALERKIQHTAAPYSNGIAICAQRAVLLVQLPGKAHFRLSLSVVRVGGLSQ